MAGAVLVASASAVSFATVASAQPAGGDLAAVEIGRFGAEDRYATSLKIAEAFVERAGGSVDNVVLVSGRHWYDAVIAPTQAWRLDAPVVMTPPGELREDTLAFLRRVKAKNIIVVSSGTGPDATISPAVIAELKAQGFTMSRNPDGDRYATSAWMAGWLGTAGSLSRSGASAIIANGEVFADALVAGPVAAKAQVPILLTPRTELHVAAEKYLRDADIAHVVLMGGTAALSEEVETAIRDLGITRIDRMAGATRFETATKFARYVAETFAAGTTETDCFDGSHVGLARGDVPFDSFSAAPLLAQRCAPLVLTRTDAVPDTTAGYLDDVRRSVSPGPVGVSVFGGNAAVSQDALDAYLGTEEPDADDQGAGEDDQPAPDLSTIEGVFAHAAAQRAAIVADLTAKIGSGAYGVDDDNVLRGPAGFRIDLDECPSGWSDTTGVTTSEIRIGYSSAQSGGLGAYGLIGTGMGNYFDWVNANDPVAGRQIVLVSKDDAYSAQQTIDNVDAFIKAENVLAITTLGSPNTLDTYDRLNDECVPQPFAQQTGHSAWGDPVNHPWTTGAQLAYNTEAILWGAWIEKNLTSSLPVRVAAVVMDNDFGFAYEQAFAQWAEAHPEVVSSFTPVRHNPAAQSLATEMQTVASANPDVYISMTAGNPCLLAIQAAGSNGLAASIRSNGGAMFTLSVCRGIAAYMEPAGAAADDWYSFAGGIKDTTDPRHTDDPFIAFVNETLRAGGLDPNNSLHGTGYLYGYPYVEALRIAAELPGGITRTNLILAVRSLDIDHPMYLDGIRYRLNGNADAYPVEGSDITQYDANTHQWQTAGTVIDVDGETPNCHWDFQQGGCR